jgi:hypothetical protein
VTLATKKWCYRCGVTSSFDPSQLRDAQAWIDRGKEVLPKGLGELLAKRDGAGELIERLPQVYTPSQVAVASPEQNAWGFVGLFYRAQARYREAIPVYLKLYDHMLAAQQQDRVRHHKGMPLVWISDSYREIGYTLISRRYLMLTLVEDALRDRGSILPREGVYFRAVSISGMAQNEVARYASEAYRFSEEKPTDALYPEWVLQQLDQDWVIPPVPQEIGVFPANPRYVRHLLEGLGDQTGESLNVLAAYLLSCMPGCRTACRQRSGTHEYDLVCSLEGAELDFRSEFGRYFVCECKDWTEKADVRTMAVLCRVLDSAKSRFGILFSKSGISGEGRARDAELEQLKIFQDRGTVIVVIDKNDMQQLAEGANFVSLLRKKYERVRLNLRGV